MGNKIVEDFVFLSEPSMWNLRILSTGRTHPHLIFHDERQRHPLTNVKFGSLSGPFKPVHHWPHQPLFTDPYDAQDDPTAIGHFSTNPSTIRFG